MATYDPGDLTYADFIDIINDPTATLSYMMGVEAQWYNWDGTQPGTNNISKLSPLYYANAETPVFPQADLPDGDNRHLIMCQGYDHLKIPDDVNPLFIEDFNTVIKTGRYGRGKCVRIDSRNWFQGELGDILEFGLPQHGFFNNGSLINAFGANTLVIGGTDFPNGYDCVLPFTVRMHVYQKPGAHWLIPASAFYALPGGATPDDIFEMKDGQLIHYINEADYLLPGGTVIATPANTVGQWYDLELRGEPTIPLVPVGSPSNGYTPRAMVWSIRINGAVLYSVSSESITFSSAGWQILWYDSTQVSLTNRETYVDNVYAVFMTPEGRDYITSGTWVIDAQEVVHDPCVGAWTGLRADGVERFRGDYTNAVKHSSAESIIQNESNIVYSPSFIIDDGLYTKFTYETPLPLPGTIKATWAVQTCAKIGSGATEQGFAWMLQGKKASLAQYDGNGYVINGVDNSFNYKQGDPVSAFFNDERTTHHQLFITPSSYGTIRIAVASTGEQA